MSMPELTTSDRAGAAMLGLAVGAQLGLDPVVDADVPFGMRCAPAAPGSPWPAAAQVGLEAARAFRGGRPDLQAFAIALGEWDARDGRGASAGLRTALRAVHQHGAPITHAAQPIGEPLLVVIPIGIVARQSPRNLASAATHMSALLAPNAEVQHAALGLAVAAAHLASGHGDFTPEVIEALKVDGATSDLLAIPRRVPLTARASLGALLGAATPARAVLEAALWCADREPIAGRGVALLAALPLAPATRSAACAAALALMGLRDGGVAVPDAWCDDAAACAAARALGRSLV